MAYIHLIISDFHISFTSLSLFLIQCPLFRDTDEAFLKQIALKTQPFLLRQGETLAYAGEICYEMYCIRRGYCEVSTHTYRHIHPHMLTRIDTHKHTRAHTNTHKPTRTHFEQTCDHVNNLQRNSKFEMSISLFQSTIFLTWP